MRASHFFNATLEKLGLCAEPVFDLYIPLDTKINIYIKGAEVYEELSASEPIYQKLREVIQVKHDFFYYLFDFGSRI
jgi:hypothetical protein